MNKLVTLLAVVLMTAPALSHAAMNGANTVNSAAIVDGSIATADIANKAVTAAKIADATITATQLANGAVTDAKITGPISVGKLPVGTTATTVAAGNHTHKYANVVTVAKSGGDYTSPIAALAAITTASATNPYLVKVMPGVYDLGAASLQMKPYVDLEGSGPEVTVITTANNNIDAALCTSGTVLMANNMAVRNIKIVNTAPNLGGDYGSPVVGIAFNNVSAKAEGVTVLVGSDTAPGGKNIGVCSYGDLAHVALNNVHVESHNVNGQSSPIRFMGGKVTVTNSKLVGFATGDTGDVQLVNNDASFIGSVTVINSILEATSGWASAFTSDGVFDVFVSNSSITLSNNSNSFPFHSFHSGRVVVVDNTKIYTSGLSCEFTNTPSDTRIANSRIPSQCTGLSGARLFNNYDENYGPYQVQ